MKKVTVSLDEETWRQARKIAAECDTTVSALVSNFLVELGSGESAFDRKRRIERELRARITHFSATDRLSRDGVHECQQ